MSQIQHCNSVCNCSKVAANSLQVRSEKKEVCEQGLPFILMSTVHFLSITGGATMRIYKIY